MDSIFNFFFYWNPFFKFSLLYFRFSIPIPANFKYHRIVCIRASVGGNIFVFF